MDEEVVSKDTYVKNAFPFLQEVGIMKWKFLWELYQSGLTYQQITSKTGVSQSTVKRHARKEDPDQLSESEIIGRSSAPPLPCQCYRSEFISLIPDQLTPAEISYVSD